MAKDDENSGAGRRDVLKGGAAAGIAGFLARIKLAAATPETAESGIARISAQAVKSIDAFQTLGELTKKFVHTAPTDFIIEKFPPHLSADEQADIVQKEVPWLCKKIADSIPQIIEKLTVFQENYNGTEEIKKDMERVAEFEAMVDEGVFDTVDSVMEHASPASQKALKAFKTALAEERQQLVKKYFCKSKAQLAELCNDFGEWIDSSPDDVPGFIAKYIFESVSHYFEQKYPERDLQSNEKLAEIRTELALELGDLIEATYTISVKDHWHLKIGEVRSDDPFATQLPNFLAFKGNKAQIEAYAERNLLTSLEHLFDQSELKGIVPEALASKKIPIISSCKDYWTRRLYCFALAKKLGIELPPEIQTGLQKKYEWNAENFPERIAPIEKTISSFTANRPEGTELPDILTQLAKHYVAGVITHAVNETNETASTPLPAAAAVIKPDTIAEDTPTTSSGPPPLLESSPPRNNLSGPLSDDAERKSFQDRVSVPGDNGPAAESWAAEEDKPRPPRVPGK